MVNYRRVVCEVALVVALVTLAGTAPTPDCDRDGEKHYDQRQNGTENYRLNIDGVVIAVAPAESLLAAASDIDLNMLFDFEPFNEVQKPKPPATQVTEQASSPNPKPEDKPQDADPESPAKPAETSLSDVSLNSEIEGQKKDATSRKQEKAQRLKNRLASLLIPLLRKTRHH